MASLVGFQAWVASLELVVDSLVVLLSLTAPQGVAAPQEAADPPTPGMTWTKVGWGTYVSGSCLGKARGGNGHHLFCAPVS